MSLLYQFYPSELARQFRSATRQLTALQPTQREQVAWITDATSISRELVTAGMLLAAMLKATRIPRFSRLRAKYV